MRVESHNSLTPVELDHHESVKISIVLGAGKVVVGFHESISSGFGAREEIIDFSCRVVMDVAEGLNI